MASTYSSILKLELIGNGDQSGTWGTTTNNNLGTLIEQAIAGTASIDVTSGDVTLTNLNGVSDQARCAALYVTGTPGVTRNLIAPAVSKLYVIANATASSVVIKTVSTPGYTVLAGSVLLVYFNGTDFVLVGQSAASTNTANTLVLRDASGNFSAGTITATLNGTATNVSGVVAVVNGGTGVTTSTGTGSTVLNTSPTLVTPALGSPTSGNFSLGTFTWPTFNQNTTGTAAGLSSTLVVGSGGTGLTSLTANSLLVGNGSSAINLIAPGTAGNILTSNGTSWTSSVPVATGVTTFSAGTTGLTPSTGTSGAITLAGTLASTNGGTGLTSFTSDGAVYATSTSALTTGTLPVASGGTGVTTSTGTGNVVLSTSPTLVTPALGSPTSGNFSLGTFTWPTFNQNTTGNAATATTSGSIANSGGWNVTPSGTKLYFNYNGTNVASLDSSGNLLVKGNVTAFATSV